MKSYFITGATGAVGSALVPLLLSDPDIVVRLLLRASTEEHLRERLEHLFRFWEVAPDDEAFRSRVIGLRGDVTLPRLGVTDAEYDDLSQSSTHIVHAAGNVRLNLPLSVALKSAVDSAEEIVALARACRRLEKLEFVSTVGVGGRMPLVPERWLREPREFHNTYEQAKAEAEEYLRRETEERGLPVTVHRPSMVVGDSHTGKIIHFQVFYYLCEFLSGRQTAGLLPRLDGVTLDTIPVDYLARALQWSSSQADTTGKILHLCSGPQRAMAVPWLIDALRELLVQEGDRLPVLKRVPLWLFRGALPVLKATAGSRVRKALDNLTVFLEYARDRQTFENRETEELLSVAGIAVPAPKNYLAPAVTRYLRDKVS